MPDLVIVGKPLSTADLSASVPTVSQKVTIPSANDDVILKGVGIGLIFFANPVFTSIGMEIWSDRNGSPGKLIASSNHTYSRAEIQAAVDSENYGFVHAGFEFDEIPLRRGIPYHVAIRAVGYTGDSSTFLGWRNTHPDPQYTTGLTITVIKGGIAPLEVNMFGAET